MDTNKKNLEMFKLEDRVLFDAAAAVEIVEADQQANNPDPNAQQSETDRQAQEDREALKNAGPVEGQPASASGEGTPVFDGGIANVDAATEALINGDIGALSEYFNQPVMTRVMIDPQSQASLSSLADDSLVIVDSTLPGSESLLASAEAQGRDVLVLDQDDGLDAVLEYLQNSDKEYGSFHFFSHANKAGVIKLGADIITDDNIQASEWREIGEYLTDDGDIMFYGCELGQNGAGRTVARQIAELADADVAVSDDITGVHGDWELEYQIGDVNHEIFIPDNYDYDLAQTKVVTVEVVEDSTDFTYDGEDMNLREAIKVVNNDFYGTQYEFYENGAADTDQSLKYCNLVAHTGTDGNIDYYTLIDELHDETTGEKFYANLTSEGKILYWNVEDVAKVVNPDYTSMKVLEVSYSGTRVSGFTIGKIETNTFELTEVDGGAAGTLTMATGNIIDKVAYKTNADYTKTYEIQFSKDAQKEANVLKWELDAITRDSVTVNGAGKVVISADDATSFSIFTNDSTGLTLKGLEISEAGKSAIYNKTGASLTIENTLLKDNSDAQNGGAVYNESGAALALKNVTFSGNTADYGGAIYLAKGDDLSAENAEFQYNVADQQGGAVYVKTGTLNVTDAYHFNANAADLAGGAIYGNTGTMLNITGGEFIGNYELNPVSSKGGAVSAETGLNVSGGTFEGNLAGYHTADGKLLYVIDGSDFGVDGALYQEAEPTGAFMRVLTAEGQLVGLVTVEGFVTLEIKETSVKGEGDVETMVRTVESAKNADGEAVSAELLAAIQATFDDSEAGQKLFTPEMSKALVGQGGAIYVASGSTLTLGAAEFIGNLAKEGGAFYSKRDLNVGTAHFQGNEASDKGGALYFDAVKLTVGKGLAFEGNRANFGGAIYTSETTRSVVLNGSLLNPAIFKDNAAILDDDGNGGMGGAICFADGVAKIDLAYVTFDGNSAGQDGGALYTPTTAAVAFKYTTFVDNRAGRDGGALFANGSNYSFTRENLFKDNEAVGDGGAIKLGYGSVATMTDMTFDGNKAGGKGGAVASDDSVLTVANVTFSGNQAAGKGGAVHIVSGNNKDAIATFTDSSFADNAADQGGALFLEMNTTGEYQTVVKIDETSFSGNTAYSFGGAIYNSVGVKAVVRNSVFVDNLLTSADFDFETAMKRYVLTDDNLNNFLASGKENVFTAVLAGAAIANAGNFTSYQNAYLSNKGSDASVKYYNDGKGGLVEYVKDEATGALILPEQKITKGSIEYTLTRTSDTEIKVTYIEPADPTDPKAKDEEKSFTYTVDEKTGLIKCSEKDPTIAALFEESVIRNQLVYRNLDGTVFTPEDWQDIPDDPETLDKDETEEKLYWATGDIDATQKVDPVIIVQLKVVTAGGAFATIADKAVTSLVSNTLYDNAAGQGGAMYQGGVYQGGVLTRHHVVNGAITDASSTVAMDSLQVNVVDTTIAGNTSFEADGYAFQSMTGKAMLLNAIVAANQRGTSDGALDFEITAHYNEAGTEIVYDFGENTDQTLDQLKDAFFADFDTGTGDISAADKDHLSIYYSVVGEFGGGVTTADYVKTDDATGEYLNASNAWLDAKNANVSVTADDVKFALWQALFVQHLQVTDGVKTAADAQLVQSEVESRQLKQNQDDFQVWYDAMSAAVAKLEVVDPEDPSENDGYTWLKGLLDTFKASKVDAATDSRILRSDMQAFIAELETKTVAEGGDNESMADARKALKDALLKTDYVETDVSITVDMGGDYGTTAMFDLVFGKTKAEATDEISVRTEGEALTYDDVLLSVDNLQAGVSVHGKSDEDRVTDLEDHAIGSDFTAERVTNYVGTNIRREADGTLSDVVYAEGEEAPVDEFGLTTVEKVRVFAYGTDSSSAVSISPAAYYQSALVKVASDNDGAIIAVSYAKPVADDTGVVYDEGGTVERIRATDAKYDSVFGGAATDIIDVDQRNFSSKFFNYTRGSWWQDGGAKLIEALVVTQTGSEAGWNTSNGLTFTELIYGIEHGIVAANIDLDQDGVYEGYKITFDASLFTDGKYTMSVSSAFELTGKQISKTTGQQLFSDGSSYNLVIDGGSDPARTLTIEALTDGCCDFIDASNAALAFNLQLQHLTIKGFNTAIKVEGTDGTKQVTNYYNADGSHQKLYSTITVEDTTITGSKAGAIDLNKGSVYVIGKSAFTDNQGGAITVGEGQVVLGIAEGIDINHTKTYGTPDTITFSGNTGVKGGAICVKQAAIDSESTYQLSPHNAGIYMEGVQSVIFANNAATDGEGGALWVKGNINITANQIDITGNTATGTKGGSIYAEGDVSLQLYGSSRLSKISGNKVIGENEAKGGAIYADGKVTIGSKAAGAFFNIDNNHVQVTGVEGNLVAQGGAIWGGSIELKDVTSVVGNTASGRDLKPGEKTLADADRIKGNLTAQGGAFYAKGDFSSTMTIAEVEGYWSDNSVRFSLANNSTGSVTAEGGAVYAGGNMDLADVYAYKNELSVEFGENGSRTAAISVVGGFAAAKGNLSFYSGEVSQSRITISATGALKNAKIAGGALYAGGNLELSHTTNAMTNNAPGSGVSSNGISVDLTVRGESENLQNVTISGGAAHADGDVDVRNAKIAKNFVNLAVRKDGADSLVWAQNVVVQGGAVAGAGGSVNDTALTNNYVIVDANSGDDNILKLDNVAILGGAVALGNHKAEISNVYAEDNYIEVKLKGKRITTYNASHQSTESSDGLIVRGGQLYANGPVTGSRLTVIGSGATNTLGINVDGFLGKKNSGFNKRDWFNLTAEGGGAYFGGKTDLSNAAFTDNNINVDLRNSGEWAYVGNVNLHGGQLAAKGDLTIVDTLAPANDSDGKPLITRSKLVNARNAAIRLSGTSFTGGLIGTIDARGGGAYATGNVVVSQYATATVGDYTIDITNNDITIDIDSWAGDVMARNNGMGLFAEMAIQMLAHTKFDLEFGIATDSRDGSGVDLGSFGDTKVGGWIEDALNAVLALLNDVLNLSRFNFSIDHTNVEGGGIYGGGTMKLTGVDATKNDLNVSYKSAFKSGTTRFILEDMNVLGAGVMAEGDLTVTKSTFNNNSITADVISESSGGTVFSAAFGILGVGKTSTSSGLVFFDGLNARGGGAYTGGALKATDSEFNGNKINVSVKCGATDNVASAVFTWLDAVPGFGGIIVNMINNGAINVDSDALLWMDYLNAEGAGAYAGGKSESVITNCQFIGNTISSSALATTKGSSAIANAIVTKAQYLTEDQKIGIGHKIDGVNSESIATADADVIVETYNVRGGGLFANGKVTYTQKCELTGNDLKASLVADASGGCVTATATYLQVLLSNTMKPAETFIVRLGAEATAHKDAYVDELRSITAYVPVLPIGGGADGFIWRIDKGFYGRPMVQGPFYLDGASGWWMLDGSTFVVQGAAVDTSEFVAGENASLVATGNGISVAEAKAKTGSVPIAITATSFFLTQLPGVPYPLMVPTIFTVDIDIEVAEAHQCAYNYFHGSTSYGQFKDCFKVGDETLDSTTFGVTVCSRECWAGAGKAEDLFYIPGLTITTLPIHAFQVGGFVIPIPWVSMAGPVPMVFMDLVVPPMGVWATYTSNGILYLPMSPAACAAALIDIGMNAAVALAANSVVSAVTNIGGFCEGAVPGTSVATGASTGGDANGASASAGASVTDGALTFKRPIVDKDGNVTGYDNVTVDLTQLALVAQAAGILDISITNGSAINKYDAAATYADDAAREAAKSPSTTRVRDVKNQSTDEEFAFSTAHDDDTNTDTVTLGEVTLVWDVANSKWTVDGEDVTDETAVLPKLSDGSSCFTLKNAEGNADGMIYIVDAEGNKYEVTDDVTIQKKSLDGTTAFWYAAGSKWLTADDPTDTVTLVDDGTMTFNLVDATHTLGTEGVRIYTLDGKDYWYDLTNGEWIDSLPNNDTPDDTTDDPYRAVSSETGLLDPNGDQVMAYSKAAETYVNLTTGELYGTRETKVVYATDVTPGKVVTTYNMADGTKATQEIELDPAGSGVTVSTYDANLNTIVTEVAANGNLKSTFHDFAKKEYNVTETSTEKNADGSYATTNKCSTYGEENDGTMAAEAKDVTYVTTEVDKDGQMLALQQITKDTFDGADSDHKKGTYEIELGTVYLDKDGQEIQDKDKAYEIKTKTETHTYDYEVWHVTSMDGFSADGGSNKHTSEVQQYWHYLDTDGNDCYVPCVEQVPADTTYDTVYLLVGEGQETISPTYTDDQLKYIGDGDYYENGVAEADGKTYQYIHKLAAYKEGAVQAADGNWYESKVEGSRLESYWQPLYDPAGDPFVLEGFNPEKGTTGINRTTGYPEGVLCKITTTVDQVKTDETTTFNGETVPVYKTVSSTAAALVADSDGHQLHVKTEMLDLTDDGVDNPTEYWVIVGGEHDGETFVNSGGNPITDGDGYAIIMSTDMYGKAPTEEGYVGPMTIDGRPACGFGETDSNIAFTYDKDGNIDGVIWVGEGFELLDSTGTDSATSDGLDMFYDVVVGQTVTEVINHQAVMDTEDPTVVVTPAWTEVKTEDITMKYFIDSDGTLRTQNGQDTFTYNTCEWDAATSQFVTVEHTGECCVVMKYVLTEVDGVKSAVKTVVRDGDGKPVVSSLLDGEQVIQIGEGQYALYLSESNYGLATTTEGYVGPATTDGQAANPGAKGNTIAFDANGKLEKSTIEIDANKDDVPELVLKFVLPGYDKDGNLVYCDVDESDTFDLANKTVYIKTAKVETKTVEVVVKDNFGQPVYDGGKVVTKEVTQTTVYQEVISECTSEAKTETIKVYDDKSGLPVFDPVTGDQITKTVSSATFKAVDTFDRDTLLAYETVTTDGDGKITADATTHEVTTATKDIESTRIEQKSYQALYKADSDTLKTLGVKTTDTVIVEVDGASGEMKVDSDGLPSNLVYNKAIDKLGEGEKRLVEKDNCGHVIYSTYKGQEVTVRTYSDGTYIFDDEGGATYTASVNGYNVIFTTGADGLLNVGEGGMPSEVETKSVKTEVTVTTYGDEGNKSSTTATTVDTDYTATTDGNGHVVYGDGTTVTLKLVMPESKETNPEKTVNTSYEVSVADNVAAYLVQDTTTGKVTVKVAQDENGNAVYENAARLTIEQAQKDEEVPPTQPDQEPTTKKVDVVSADDKVVYEIKPFDEDGESIYFKDFYDTESKNKDIADAAKKLKEADAEAGYEKIILTDDKGDALMAKDKDGNPVVQIAYKNLATGLIYNSDGIVLNALTDDTGAVVYDVDGLSYTDTDGNLVLDADGSVIYTAKSLTLGGVEVKNAHIEVGVNGQVVSRSLVDPVTHTVVKVPTCLMTIKTATGEKYACNSDASAIYNELNADGDRYLDADGSPSNVWTNAKGEPILDSTGRAVYIALDDTGTPQLNSDGTPANVANINKLETQPVQYYATNELGRVIKDRAGNRILIESDPETNMPLYDENGLPTTVLMRANGSMVYDAAGNVIYLTMGKDGLAVWTAYDAEGNVIVSELDDTGAEVWKQYDADGKTVINENATFDHYENTKLLTADAITVDQDDNTKATLDLGSNGTKSLVKSEAGVWYVDIGSKPGEQDPKDMRLETQTFETDHGTITLVSDGFGNVLYMTSKFDGSVQSVSGKVPSETLATPYDTTTHKYTLTQAEQEDDQSIYVYMASGANTPEVEGTLAYALAHANGRTIKFADGLFTGGKAVILIEETLTIGADVTLDAGQNADMTDRELVIRTAEPGLWFAAGYQDDSQQWIEANGKIIDPETQDRELPTCYVYAPDYGLFNIAANVTSVSMTNITFEGGHVTDAGAVFNASGDRGETTLTLTLDGSNIFRSNADKNGGAVYVNGDLDLVLKNDAQIAVNNGAEGGAIYANGNVSIDGDGMLVRNTTEQANGGAVSARGSVELDGTLEFVANVAKGDGGAVYSLADGDETVVTMTDGVVFALNTAAGRGGALFIKTESGSTRLSVDSARFLGNEAGAEGGALYIEAASRDNRMDINDADFTGNKSGKSGGAVFFATTGTITDAAGTTAGKAAEVFFNAENTRFDSNIAAENGGAIEASYGRITLKGAGTVITDNVAGKVGGAIDAGGVVTVGKGVMFDGNTAGTKGGAIALSDGQMSITSATFDGNASHGDGGAIAILEDALSVTIISSAFMVNNATNAGGAIYSSAKDALIVNRKSTFNANSVGQGQGGAVAVAAGEYQASGNIYFANRAATDGGAISVTGKDASAVVKSSKFYDNSAVNAGGAVFAGDKANVEIGNSVFASGTTVGYVTSSGKGNVAAKGGAIAATGAAKLVVSSSGKDSTKFIQNSATEAGGTIYVENAELQLKDASKSGKDGSILIEGSRTDGNGGAIAVIGTGKLTSDVNLRIKAADGVSVQHADKGGAIYAQDKAQISLGGKNEITGMDANQGGALYLTGNANLDFNGETTISGNEADKGGAVYFAGGSHINFNATTEVLNNTATTGSAFYVMTTEPFSINTKLVDVHGNTGYGTFYVGTGAQANFSKASFVDDGQTTDYIVVANGAYLGFNQSSLVGGGIVVENGGKLAMANATVTLNLAGYGVYLKTGSEAALANVSIVRNKGGLKVESGADALLLNSILVGNADTTAGVTDIDAAAAGLIRGGSIYYTVASDKSFVPNNGGRNRVGRTYDQTFYESGLHVAANGTYYYMPKTETPAQEYGSRVSGGIKETAEGSGKAIYTDKRAGKFEGVANRFASDLTYDQRGTHRYEYSFGAVIETQNILNEDSVSGVTNNGYTVIAGMQKGGGLPKGLAMTMSEQADAAEILNNSEVMAYATNGGQRAFVTAESVLTAGDIASGYVFSAMEAGVLMGDDLNLGGVENALDILPVAVSNYVAAMNAMNQTPIGQLARVAALQSDYEAMLEDLQQ